MPGLEIVGLEKRFGGVVALDGIDLSIGSDQIVGVIGPNGSGKTTLFNVICGLYRPTAGEIRWQGETITGLRPHEIARRGIGHTFQQAMAFPALPVAENVQIALEHGSASGTRRWRSAAEILAFVGLAGLSDTLAGGLSFGNLRRLGVAIALGGGPRQLMLDEPAAGLNAGESAELAELLRRVHAMGVGVCIVDHDVKMMTALCERLVVLNFGTKVADGPTAAVLDDARVVEIYLGADP
jgi:ABC-type branched-subunit amino acid transport system ATPase component